MKMIKDSKLLLKIFSGFIAVVLWFAVTYTEDPSINQHLGRLDTVFYNEDKLAERGLIVVDKDTLPSFSVTIRGKRSKVISSLDRVSAGIDVASITSAGNHEVDVEYSYPISDVNLSKERYSTISLKVEKLLTKDVPVKINSRPDKKDKDHLIGSSFAENVTVSGAKSFISKVSYARIDIDDSDIDTNGTISYAYTFFDSNDKKLEEKNIYSKSHENIPVTHTIYNRIELPVKVVLPEDLQDEYTLKINDQDVTKISVGVLDKPELDELEAVFESEDPDAKEGTASLRIQAPDGVYIPASSQKVNIEYKLVKKSEQSSEAKK